MAGHVYTGYGYFLAEYKYLYQVYFQKMFYKRLRCFLELIHNVTQMTPDDTSSKKCFQRSKKIQSRYTPSMAEELWDLQDMFKVMGRPPDICSGYGIFKICFKVMGHPRYV
jgi:hypothetical protein